MKMARIPERINEIKKLVKTEQNTKAKIALYREHDWLQNILNLWQKLEDHPYDPETECITAPYIIFPAGTHREEIWHWFENSFHICLAEDLMY